MKITFLLSLNLTVPGPSVHILTSLLSSLADAGHAVRVVEPRPAGAGVLPPALEGRVDATALPVKAQDKRNFAARYLAQARYALSTRRALRDADLVYVHSSNTPALFAYLVRHACPRARLVVNVQDIFPENAATIGALNPKGLMYRTFRRMARYAYRRADAVTTLSEDMRRTLIAAGAPEERTHVLGLWSYGDDIGCVDEADNRFLAAHPEERGFFRALYAGNVGAMQNVELILDAAERLLPEARVRFLIVGDGARKAEHERRAREHGLTNVRFYPMQDSSLAVDLYSMADVNLITLAPGVIATAFPSKTTTCFAVGKPVIAAVDPTSDYAKMVAGCDKCFALDPADGAALAERIRKNFEEGVGGCSEGARALYRSMLSQEAGIARHIALFEQLVSGKGDAL